MNPWREVAPGGLPPGSRVVWGRLSGGLRVWFAEVPGARRARLALGVGAGYLDEPDIYPGLAHLLEHALFLAGGDTSTFGDWVGAQGGHYNARTDDRVTDFHLTLPPEALAAGLARLMALVAEPRFDPDAVAREVAVIDAEFHARLADPALHRLAALSRLCRAGHPGRHCHAGNATTLGADPVALCSALEAFHRRHYRAGAMSLALLAPRPLAEQRTWGEAAAARLPRGGTPRAPEAWWSSPGGVQWVSPAGGGELELVWPLPAGAAARWHGSLTRLAAVLTDGRLAATLAARHRLAALEASPEITGAGPGLSLRLTLDDASPAVQKAVLATCAARVQALAADPASLPAAAIAAADLETWPRERVREACRRDAREAAAADARPLSTWLAPRHCRWLVAVDALPGADGRVASTGTRYRLEGPLPTTPATSSPAPSPLPATANPPVGRASGASPRRLAVPGLVTWWGGAPAGLAATLCLGWPAAACGRAARLSRWRQDTLALVQAVAHRGGRLEPVGDARGDWLAIIGHPAVLEGVARAALAAWPGAGGDRSARHAPGLLAQRLLARLEEAAPEAALKMLPCGWVAGLADEDATALVMRLRAALPWASPNVVSAGQDEAAIRVVSDGDHAVMLQVEGGDAPLERLYLRLLAQCHDAAFFDEMRRRRGLGYVAAVRYREAAGRPRLGYVVQSPHTGVDALQAAIEDFLATRGRRLAALDEATFEHRRRALAGQCGLPETPLEAWRARWQALRRGDPAPPGVASRAALGRLDAAGLAERAEALVDGRLARCWWRGDGLESGADLND